MSSTIYAQSISIQTGYSRLFHSSMNGISISAEFQMNLSKKKEKFSIGVSYVQAFANTNNNLPLDNVSASNLRVVSSSATPTSFVQSSENFLTYETTKSSKTYQSIAAITLFRNWNLNSRHQFSFGLGVYYTSVVNFSFLSVIEMNYGNPQQIDGIQRNYIVPSSYNFTLFGFKADTRYLYLIKPNFHIGLKAAYYHLDAPFYGMLQIAPNFVFRY